MHCLFPGLYSEGPRSVKINGLLDVISCCGCAKMSAQFTGRLPEWGLLHRTLGTVTGAGGIGHPLRSEDGSGLSAGGLGRCTCLSFLSFFVLRTPGPITHVGQEDAGRV